MTDKDTITLPRELVFRAVKALTPMAYDTWPRERQEIVTALRKALAAEQPKPSEDIEALRRDAERLREAVEAYIRAKDSDGGGKGGFFPKPPTVAHQRRVHLAWQELNAALRREET